MTPFGVLARLFDGEISAGRLRARLALSLAVRLRLYRKLAGLLGTGMPLPRALDTLWQTVSDDGRRPTLPLAMAIDHWRKQVYDGRTFGRSLADWVPAREWMVIEAGSGNLAQALEDAAGLIETSRRVVGAVVGAVTYPAFLVLLLSVILWIFSVQAIPAFAQVKPMDQWTGLAAGMGIMAQAVHAGLLPLAAAAALMLAGALWAMPRWTGDWRCAFDRLAPWSLYRMVVGAGFMASLVAFMRAGMPVPEAVRRLRPGAGPWLAERLDAALYYLNSGYDLGTALHLAGHRFPDRSIVEDLRVYASLGNLEGALQRIAAEWTRESIERLNAFADSMKVAGMVLVAGMVGWIQIGIITVQQQLTAGG